ncbi:MAG: prepilin-type N-terminal cleavage/methylation domain-containing protein [Candidatus Babeliaceae bacterium]|nr:prepilin-type N-terminal cleavage/methylation domain-containing protein [Candidatus Babeliaceae bacterium]
MVHRGFSLIEVMIVIAIIAFFAVLALPNFMTFLAKAKRSEAHIQLRALYMLQKAYFAEHGTYTDKLQGAASLNWKPEGQVNYTYGFPGSFVLGAFGTPASALSGASVGAQAFTIAAAGDIDNDGDYDILTINEKGEITLVKDDLQ